MKPVARHMATAARVLFGFGLLAYILVEWVDQRALQSLIQSPWILGGFVALTLLGIPLESLRLVLLCRAQSVHLDFVHGCRLASVGTFFNFTMPGGSGGDIAKLYYLVVDDRSQFIPLTTVLFVNRLAGLTGLLSFILALTPFLWQIVTQYRVVQFLVISASTGLVTIICIAAMSFSYRFRSTRSYEFLVTRAPLAAYVRKVSDAMFAYRKHKMSLVIVLLTSVIGVVAMSGMFSVAASVLFSESSVILVSFLSMLGMVANAIPITPGGIGVGEAAFDALFGLVGYGSAALLVLSWRVANVPIGIGGGLLYVLGIRRRANA